MQELDYYNIDDVLLELERTRAKCKKWKQLYLELKQIHDNPPPKRVARIQTSGRAPPMLRGGKRKALTK
jgi:hypothetical protein